MIDGHPQTSPGQMAHAGVRSRRRLLIAGGLTAAFFVVELVVGLVANSLALLSDAAHMFTDVLGLGMALAAIQVAARGSRRVAHSFGLYRLEILAALANAVLLFGVAIYVIVEAVGRLSDPPDVLGVPMLVAATLGLVVNLVAFWLLRGGADESLNVEGAYLEVLADTLGSVGVLIAAVVVQTTGFGLIDPIFAVAIGVFVLPRTYRLGRKALRILLQMAPDRVDLGEVATCLGRVEGVADVHDLHVWTLTSGMEVASVHLRLRDGADDPHLVLDRARNHLRDEHDIEHATVQVEPAAHAGCDDCEAVTW